MRPITLSGHLQKMRVEPGQKPGDAHYWLRLDQQEIALNPFIGQPITLTFAGEIHCAHCGRRSRKSYGQGHCYPCFKALPQCDRCMVSPEFCHYHQGTCRDAAWGERVCMSDHIVYLANASGLKVGITRATQMPTRWLDQGAGYALALFRVPTRRLSGQIEDLLRQTLNDRTQWRKMLQSDVPEIDLIAERAALWSQYAEAIGQIARDAGVAVIEPLWDQSVQQFNYPVLAYPSKVKTHNFDKTAQVSGRLMGIKGQYLLLDTGVINLRKFTAYKVTAELGR